MPNIEMCVTVQPFQAASRTESNPQAKQQQQSQQQQAKQPAAGGVGHHARCSQADPETDANRQKYSFHSFGAQFAEVRVDEDTGMVSVTRFLSVHHVGRILNEKTARSQMIGGVVYGLGQALMEETAYDNAAAIPSTERSPIITSRESRHARDRRIFIEQARPAISPIGAQAASARSASRRRRSGRERDL